MDATTTATVILAFVSLLFAVIAVVQCIDTYRDVRRLRRIATRNTKVVNGVTVSDYTTTR